jgi:hypothetical protein
MKRAIVGATVVGLCALSMAEPRVARACCQPEQVRVWVHGSYSNANQGDVMVNIAEAGDLLQPVVEAIGENYDHAMALFRPTMADVMENLGDPNTIITGWDCSHPIDPESNISPMYPGAQIAVFADSTTPDANYYEFKQGEILHGAVHTTATNIEDGNYCVVWPLGSSLTPQVGYYLYGYSHRVTNGMCVDMLTDSCFVPRPAPKAYAASTVANAASAIYQEVTTLASNEESWLDQTWCGSGEPEMAGNQVVNTFLNNNPWDTSRENWSVAVTAVVSPGQLEATYPAAQKVPAELVAGYWTTQMQMVCTKGICP